MRIVDLLKKDSIMLCGSPKSKSEAIGQISVFGRKQNTRKGGSVCRKVSDQKSIRFDRRGVYGSESVSSFV